jgi:site-specific recombinase XerD
VGRPVSGRTGITLKARENYEWAIPHVEAGLGAIPVARLDREDVAEWIEALAAGGKLSRRSVQICRTVLRAALADAVDEGIIPRSAAARVALPRSVAKPAKVKEIEAWDAAEVARFLETPAPTAGRSASALASYGLRHTAATHMVADATDIGQLRAIAALLGHSADMLMKTYAHAMPASTSLSSTPSLNGVGEIDEAACQTPMRLGPATNVSRRRLSAARLDWLVPGNVV